MKIKIAILGSTGSIGKTLFKIIKDNKKSFEIVLLTANKDHKTLLKQAKILNVKNLIITEKKSFDIISKKNLSKINLYNSFETLDLIFKKKIDYVMNSIVGLDGLYPTIKIIKHTKKIAIANKESIICGWSLIQKQLKKNNTKFIPVDSEHFSIWYSLNNASVKNIEKIYLTASGGPFLKTPLNRFKNIKINNAIRHPNWKMGRKISIDSATLINKVYEVIEAKKIFNLPYNKIEILIHTQSYVHCLVKFINGMTKVIVHDTTMKIPIFNTLYDNFSKKIGSKKIDFSILNNLNFTKVNLNRFPMVKLINLMPGKNSLYETVIVSANDTLVDLFLKKQINFITIQKELFKIIKLKEFIKLKKITPNNIEEIVKLKNYVRLKILKKVYKVTDAS